MISRRITHVVRNRLADYPAVTLVGPRQSGKTTLAKAMEGRYFDLEQEADRLRLDLEWPELVQGETLIILDEAQVWPDVFPRLRGAIDHDRQRLGRGRDPVGLAQGQRDRDGPRVGASGR